MCHKTAFLSFRATGRGESRSRICKVRPIRSQLPTRNRKFWAPRTEILCFRAWCPCGWSPSCAWTWGPRTRPWQWAALPVPPAYFCPSACQMQSPPWRTLATCRNFCRRWRSHRNQWCSDSGVGCVFLFIWRFGTILLRSWQPACWLSWGHK